MKVLITDLHCASNRGDAAIAQGLVLLLHQALPAAQFKIATEYPAAAQILIGLPAVQQRPVFIQSRNFKKVLALLYLLFSARLGKAGSALPAVPKIRRKLGLEAYVEADLIVSTGGSHINDFYTPASLGRLLSLFYAKSIGKKVVLLCQSFGPFHKPISRLLVPFVLNRMDLITTRDERSKGILESLGVNSAKVHVTADAALALAPSTEQLALRTETLPDPSARRLRVSVSVRAWNYFRKPGGQEKYFGAIAELVNWLVKDLNAHVTFASTCTGLDSYHKDDRVTAAEIFRRLEPDTARHCSILFNEYSPTELSRFFGGMTIHIGTRMHSNILALLSGTPVIALEYEFKTSELMKALHLNQFLLDVNEVELDRLKRCVTELLKDRDKVAAGIRERLNELRMVLAKNGELMRSLPQIHQE